MRVGRGSWHVLRLHVPRAHVPAAAKIGSSNRDRKLFYITPTPCPTRKIRHSVMRAVYRDSLFSTRRVFRDTVTAPRGGDPTRVTGK